MQFDIEDKGEVRKYSFLREERYQFQGLRNENSVEIEMEVTLLSITKEIPVFKITTLGYRQSNADRMYQWVGDLHELRKEIICTLNEKGQLGEVLNMEEIKEAWDKMKLEVKKLHKGEMYIDLFIIGVSELLEDPIRFSSTLRFSMPYLLLFPGIHYKEFKKGELSVGYRELPNFLATKNLPIITEEKLTELENGKYQIDVSGMIDEEKFEQDKVTAMIRILKNRPRVPTQVQLQYMERYLLEDWPWSEQSMCMSLAEIPGTLYREEKNILKAI